MARLHHVLEPHKSVGLCSHHLRRLLLSLALFPLHSPLLSSVCIRVNPWMNPFPIRFPLPFNFSPKSSSARIPRTSGGFHGFFRRIQSNAKAGLGPFRPSRNVHHD